MADLVTTVVSDAVTSIMTTIRPENQTNPCDCSGIILPLTDECGWNQNFRAFLYFVALLWSFLGIAELADKFMCSIEQITSMARVVHKYEAAQTPLNVEGSDKERVYVGTKVVKFWNETVANLTLMALGSSAPEILLSCIEIVGNGFRSGELGPGTIVGSAAFNLLIISAACMAAIPSPAVRRIKRQGVFLSTAFFSVFAYVWLFLILMIISPNVIEVWEAIVTLAMFPFLVVLAYFLDRQSHRQEKRAKMAKGDVKKMKDDDIHNYILEIRKMNPDLKDEQVLQLARDKFVRDAHSSRGWYRINANRMMSGSSKLQPKLADDLDKAKRQQERRHLQSAPNEQEMVEMELTKKQNGEISETYISFEKSNSHCIEDDGKIDITVRRLGNLNKTSRCWVETLDGTAKYGEDYDYTNKPLTFEPGEQSKTFTIGIVNDTEYEPDEVFFVKLISPDSADGWDLGQNPIHTVVIVDTDHPGRATFLQARYEISDASGQVRIPVQRQGGLSGEINVHYNTVDLTAKAGPDYEETKGTLHFSHGEMEKFITVPIMNTESVETVFFEVLLSDDGNDLIGERRKALVSVVDDKTWSDRNTNLETKVADIVKNLGFNASWKENFKKALNVNGGEIESATGMDYAMHILNFGWKFIGALVPPVHIAGGWLSFAVSLGFVGILTAIVGDLAGIFGCIIGLKDTVTAITLVALGTSLPDTFASYMAARDEEHCDSAIGNITGSNSVNVFLGLGVPWVIASIYWAAQGKQFDVNSGSLGFSVLLYCCVSMVAIGLFIVRRRLPICGNGEIGGTMIVKIACIVILISLWCIYITFSTLQAYGLVKDPFAK